MKLVKYTLWLLGICAIGFITFIIYLQFIKVEKLSPLQAMRSESVIVVETKNLTSAWKEIKNSDLWVSMIEAEYFDEYEANMMFFDSLMVENPFVRSVFKNRPLALAVQMINDNDFETVFAVDIGKYGKLSVMPKLASLMNYELKERLIDSTSVYSVCYDRPSDIVHLCIYENLLIGSLPANFLTRL